MDENTRRSIRRKAENFRENCRNNKYGIMDIFEECNRSGYRLLRYPIEGESALGFALKRDGDYIIFTNSAVRLSREIFTLAHEIGHVILHLNSGRAFIDNKQTLDDSENNEEEQEANYFAACLLMPEESVRKFFDIELNNMRADELAACDIAKLMSEFSMSFEAVLNSLEDFGIINSLQKARLNSEKNKNRVGNLLKVIGGNRRLNEVSNDRNLPYQYLDYVIFNYNHNAVPRETLEKVLGVYQLTIEDVSDKLTVPKETGEFNLDELIGGIDD